MAVSIRIRAFLAVLLVTLVLASGAHADECQNRDGTSRDCTLSENVEMCIDATWDAYFQCVEEASGEPGSLEYAWETTGCQLWLAADQLACSVEAFKIFKM